MAKFIVNNSETVEIADANNEYCGDIYYCAKYATDGDTITFSDNISSIKLTQQLDISTSVTIAGKTGKPIEISSTTEDAYVNITNNAKKVVCYNLCFKNMSSKYAIVAFNDHLLLFHCDFINNKGVIDFKTLNNIADNEGLLELHGVKICNNNITTTIDDDYAILYIRNYVKQINICNCLIADNNIHMNSNNLSSAVIKFNSPVVYDNMNVNITSCTIVNNKFTKNNNVTYFNLSVLRFPESATININNSILFNDIPNNNVNYELLPMSSNTYINNCCLASYQKNKQNEKYNNFNLFYDAENFNNIFVDYDSAKSEHNYHVWTTEDYIRLNNGGNSRYYGDSIYDVEGNFRNTGTTSIGCYEDVKADLYYIGPTTSASLYNKDNWSELRFPVTADASYNRLPKKGDKLFIDKNVEFTDVFLGEDR